MALCGCPIRQNKVGSLDNCRVPGIHSLVGAIIRQAVVDYKSEYHERTGEYPAYQFLHRANLLKDVNNLYAAILSSDADMYRQNRRFPVW